MLRCIEPLQMLLQPSSHFIGFGYSGRRSLHCFPLAPPSLHPKTHSILVSLFWFFFPYNSKYSQPSFLWELFSSKNEQENSWVFLFLYFSLSLISTIISQAIFLHALFFSSNFFLGKTSFISNSFPLLQADFSFPSEYLIFSSPALEATMPLNQTHPFLRNDLPILSLLNDFRIFPQTRVPHLLPLSQTIHFLNRQDAII